MSEKKLFPAELRVLLLAGRVGVMVTAGGLAAMAALMTAQGLFWCRRTAAGNSSRWCREPLQRLDRCILQKGTRPAVWACTGPVLCGIARGAQRSFRYAYGRAAAAAVCCADPVRQYWRIAGHGDPGEKAPQLNKIKTRRFDHVGLSANRNASALARSRAAAPTGEAALLPQPQKTLPAQNDPHRKCLHRCRDITRKPGRKPAGCSSVPF